MNKTVKTGKEQPADYFLDITGEVCPLTFVKTKLLIESMSAGQTAEVLLQGKEPLDNVPRNVTDHGHTVLSLEPVDPDGAAHGDPHGPHRLLLQKT